MASVPSTIPGKTEEQARRILAQAPAGGIFVRSRFRRKLGSQATRKKNAPAENRPPAERYESPDSDTGKAGERRRFAFGAKNQNAPAICPEIALFAVRVTMAPEAWDGTDY